MDDLLISRNGDPAYGALTLSLPFMPTIQTLIYGHSLLLTKHFDCGTYFKNPHFFLEVKNPPLYKVFFMKALKRLPFVHLIHNYKTLQKITSLHKEIGGLKDLKVKDTKNEELDKIKSDFQNEKVFPAMLESAPQFILQLSILLKKYYSGDVDDLPYFFQLNPRGLVFLEGLKSGLYWNEGSIRMRVQLEKIR